MSECGRVVGGRYRLLEPLGQGAMGQVWRAENVTLGSKIAIKLIDPAIAQRADVRVRFFQEAQAAASLNCPYVVQIIIWPAFAENFRRTYQRAVYQDVGVFSFAGVCACPNAKVVFAGFLYIDRVLNPFRFCRTEFAFVFNHAVSCPAYRAYIAKIRYFCVFCLRP